MPDVSDEFDVAVTWDVGGRTIVVTGELDLATSPPRSVARRRLADGTGDVVVDLSAVTFLDSTALTVLVTYRQQLASAGAAWWCTDRRRSWCAC